MPKCGTCEERPALYRVSIATLVDSGDSSELWSFGDVCWLCARHLPLNFIVDIPKEPNEMAR